MVVALKGLVRPITKTLLKIHTFKKIRYSWSMYTTELLDVYVAVAGTHL